MLVTSAVDIEVKNKWPHGPRNKGGPGSQTNKPSSNLKLERIIRSPKVKPPSIKRSKAGVTLFQLDTHRSKNLVPHQ
jgi:hypothetical protein